jgi:hypothetical protein
MTERKKEKNTNKRESRLIRTIGDIMTEVLEDPRVRVEKPHPRGELERVMIETVTQQEDKRQT